jgi:hypothetical protein
MHQRYAKKEDRSEDYEAHPREEPAGQGSRWACSVLQLLHRAQGGMSLRHLALFSGASEEDTAEALRGLIKRRRVAAEGGVDARLYRLAQKAR